MVLDQSKGEFNVKRRNRNFGLAMCLAGFIVMIFLVTIAKLSSGGMIEGFDHTLRMSVYKE